jgi:hypothetical protein
MLMLLTLTHKVFLTVSEFRATQSRDQQRHIILPTDIHTILVIRGLLVNILDLQLQPEEDRYHLPFFMVRLWLTTVGHTLGRVFL